MKRMPAVFLPHGGGPWPWIGSQRADYANMTHYLRGLPHIAPERPKALLLISAHWEAALPTLMTAQNPSMLYDYSGFPPETYQITWPAPGAPELADVVTSLLSRAGIASANDPKRGYDHGTFVPLSVMYPEANIPVLQLSLVRGLDPRVHFELGQALEPLRDQGVLIVGSGMSYHNIGAFMQQFRGGPPPTEDSRRFDEWLVASMQLAPDQRESRLIEWEQAPAARASHPREEHLLPLHVVAGASGNDVGTVPYRDLILGAHVSAVHFG